MNGPITVPAPADLLDRMVRAVARVRERLHRVSMALEEAGIPYAVAGEQAVSAWVSRVDEGAIRNSPEIEILLNRSDLEHASRAMSEAGFVFRHLEGNDVFLESQDAQSRDAVRIVYAREAARPADLSAAPGIEESDRGGEFPIVGLDALLRMKLESFRHVDRVNVRDLIDVGLVDETWLPRLPSPLAERLKELLENPEG